VENRPLGQLLVVTDGKGGKEGFEKESQFQGVLKPERGVYKETAEGRRVGTMKKSFRFHGK